MPENVAEPESQAVSVAQAQWVESTGTRPIPPTPTTVMAQQASIPEPLALEQTPIFSSTPESTLEAAPAPVPESASSE
jgi:hypothetical protein